MPWFDPLLQTGLPIPAHLKRVFHPAQVGLYEWQDYWLDLPGADRLQVGADWHAPVHGSVFRLRFENHLGLARLQAYAGPQRLGPELTVEVISPKFPTLDVHYAFLSTLIADLYARAAALPCALPAATARQSAPDQRSSSLLFIYYFLTQQAAALEQASRALLASPQRDLRYIEQQVGLGQAAEVDEDVLLSIVHNSADWRKAGGFALAQRLHGYAPQRVWQRLPEETLDTPENRFVLAFWKLLLGETQRLGSQPWWPRLPAEGRAVVERLAAYLPAAIGHATMVEVGPLQRLPLESAVLRRKDGYRELWRLWALFHSTRRPLFAALEQAVALRDIATLYEQWAFFRLVDDLQALFRHPAQLSVPVSDLSGLAWQARADFGAFGCLDYNHSLTYQSYSVPLRPDFIWQRDGRLELVFDAKFRLQRPQLERDDAPAAAGANRSDLYKMHAYRDALKVRAALALYPGDLSVFYDASLGRTAPAGVSELFFRPLAGIGALPFRPHPAHSEAP